MKKLFFIMAACAVIVSCQQKGKTEANQNANDTTLVSDSSATDSLKYSGVVPAADGPGIKYTLTLAADSTNGFALEQVYLEAEKGKDAVYNYNGTAETIVKKVDNKEQKAYKLNLDKDNTLYLLVKNDSTLTLVGDDLKETKTVNNYDLKLVK